jgi:hypothetical protein
VPKLPPLPSAPSSPWAVADTFYDDTDHGPLGGALDGNNTWLHGSSPIPGARSTSRSPRTRASSNHPRRAADSHQHHHRQPHHGSGHHFAFCPVCHIGGIPDDAMPRHIFACRLTEEAVTRLKTVRPAVGIRAAERPADWGGDGATRGGPAAASSSAARPPRVVFVEHAHPNALEAGVVDGDVIASLDGRDVRTLADLGTIVRSLEPGSEVPITVLRRAPARVAGSLSPHPRQSQKQPRKPRTPQMRQRHAQGGSSADWQPLDSDDPDDPNPDDLEPAGADAPWRAVDTRIAVGGAGVAAERVRRWHRHAAREFIDLDFVTFYGGEGDVV